MSMCDGMLRAASSSSQLQPQSGSRTGCGGQTKRCVHRQLVDQTAQHSLMPVERPQTRFADAQVAEGAHPAILRVGLVARLAREGVVPVRPPVHGPVILVTAKVRDLERLCGDHGARLQQPLCLCRKVGRPWIGLPRVLHLRVQCSISSSVERALRLRVHNSRVRSVGCRVTRPFQGSLSVGFHRRGSWWKLG